MASNSSYITSVIEMVNKHYDVSFSVREKLRKELSHLKIFLVCAEGWISVDEDVRDSLADLMADIEDVFDDTIMDLEDAEDGGKEKLIEAYTELQEKIEQFQPKVREGYVFLSEYCFRARLSVTDMKFWIEVIGAVHTGLQTLVSDVKMVAPLKRQVEAFIVNFWSLSLLMTYLNSCLSGVKKFMPFCVYLGSAATCAAQVSYLCWVNGMNANKSQGLIILLSGLQHKIMPSTSETIDVYLGFMKDVRSVNSYYVDPCVKQIAEHSFSI